MFVRVHLVTPPVTEMCNTPSTFGPTRMRSHQLVWVREGILIARIDGGAPITSAAGTLFLFRRGMTVAYTVGDPGPTVYAAVAFLVDLDPDWSLEERTWPLTRQIDDHPLSRSLFQHLLDLGELKPAHWNALIEVEAASLFMSAVARSAEPRAAAGVHPAVARVVRFVEAEWSDGKLRHITLDQLADAACVSRPHLSRIFNEHCGHGPAEVLRFARLSRAAELLAHTSMPVRAVADLTGFPEPNHFSEIFRMLFGVSPRSYRRLAAQRLIDGARVVGPPAEAHLNLIDVLATIESNRFRRDGAR